MSARHITFVEPVIFNGAGPWKRAYTNRNEWESHKARILELRRNNVRLSDIKRIIERETGFVASEAQYKRRLEAWKDRRKLTKAQRKFIIQQILRKGKILAFQRCDGERIDEARIRNVWDKRQNDGVIQLEDALSPNGIEVVPSPEKHAPCSNVRKELLLRIEGSKQASEAESRSPEEANIPHMAAENFAKWMLGFLKISVAYEYKEERCEYLPLDTKPRPVFAYPEPSLQATYPKKSYKNATDELVKYFVSSYLPLGRSSDQSLKEKRLVQINTRWSLDCYWATHASLGCLRFDGTPHAAAVDAGMRLHYSPYPAPGFYGWQIPNAMEGNNPGMGYIYYIDALDMQTVVTTRVPGVLEYLKKRAEGITGKFGPRSIECLQARFEVAKAFDTLYFHSEAESGYIDICEKLELWHGASNEHTRKALLVLARFYRRHLRLDEAWKYVWKAAATSILQYTGMLSTQDVELSPLPNEFDDISRSALGIVAEIYCLQSNSLRAKDLAQALYNADKQVYGKKSRECLASLGRLGWILLCNGELQQATETLTLAKQIAGEKSAWNITKLDIEFHLHHISLLAGKSEQTVEENFLEDLVLRETQYPNIVGSLCSTLESLAKMNAARRDFVKSIGYYERCLITFGRSYGESHAHTLRVVNNLVPVLVERGLVMYARPLAHYILKVVENLYGPLHPAVLEAIIQASQLSCAAAASSWEIGEWRAL